MAAKTRVRSAGLYVRIFNKKVGRSEMMLAVAAACRDPTVNTANSPGGVSRETMVCSFSTMAAASTT